MATASLELRALAVPAPIAGDSSTVLLAFLIGVGSLELTEKLGCKTLLLEVEADLFRVTLWGVPCKGKPAIVLVLGVDRRLQLSTSAWPFLMASHIDFTAGESLVPLFILLSFLRQCWIALQMDWDHFLHVWLCLQENFLGCLG